MTSAGSSPRGDAADEPAAPSGAGLMHSTWLTLATRVAMFGLSLFTNIVLARALGPHGRGVYAIVTLIPSLLTLLVSLGVGPSNVYQIASRSLSADDVSGHSVSLAVILGAGVYAAALASIWLGGADRVGVPAGYVLIAVMSVGPALLTAFLQGVFQALQRFGAFNAVLTVQYVASALLIAAGVVLHPSDRVGAAVVAWTASSIGTGLLAAGIAARTVDLRPRFRIATLSPLLRFGVVSYFSSLTSFLNYRFDLFLVNALSGPAQAGLYSVATGLAEITWFLPNSAAIALAPRTTSASAAEAVRLTAITNRLLVLLTGAGAAALAAVAPLAIAMFFGRAFEASAAAVWLLLPGIVAFSVAKTLATYLLSRNKLRIDLAAGLAGLAATVVLDLVLIPRWGMNGAAVASSIAYMVTALIEVAWVLRHTNLTVRALLLPGREDLRLLFARLAGLVVKGRPQS